MNRLFLLNILRTGALLCAWLAVGSSYAHGGEDHSSPAPAPAAARSAGLPRASATTEDFELVAVFEADPPRLVIHLDRAASNEPVGKATLEFEGAGLAAKAVESASGVYTVSLPQPLLPGAHALNFTVQSPVGADLIVATLNVPVVDTSGGSTTPSRFRPGTVTAAWLGGAALLAGAGLTFLLLRRRRNANPSSVQPRETS